MFIRTYLRTLFNDIFKNNFVIHVISKIVNFYKDLWLSPTETVKFTPGLPINDLDKKKIISFQSISGDKLDCR